MTYTVDEMKKEVELYFNDELKSIARFIKANPDLNFSKLKQQAKDRGMGIVMFIQAFDVPFDFLNEKYEEFKKALDIM